MTKTITASILFLLFFIFGNAQVGKRDQLYITLKEKDSLLFNEGFNKCSISQFEKLLSESFEFYHDQGGITSSKKAFIEGVKKNVCTLSYRAERRLDNNSLEVFPLNKNGVLYGAIQQGVHHFYAIEKDGSKYLTSTAKFTHVWLLENGDWKLSKGLSYDHQDFEKPKDDLLFNDKKVTEQWMKEKHIPTLGIGVIRNGKIENISVFGDLEKGKAAPLNTIWNVASLTKPITALVTLKLVEAGKWNLDEPVRKYFVDPDVANDPNHNKLTSRFILSHRSGFPNWRRMAKDGKLHFDFEPGTKYEYSGEGYEYLRKALEKKFGKTLDQLAKELILDPLKMNNTQFFWDKNTDEKRFAKWYNKKGEVYETDKTTSASAADDVLTTVEDYLKFMVYVMNGGGLSEKLQKEMVSDQTRVNSSKHFGLGWWIDENINAKGDFAMVHGGDDKGVHTIAFMVPATKDGLLIFTNCDNGTDAFADILVKFLGKDGEGILKVEMK